MKLKSTIIEEAFKIFFPDVSFVEVGIFNNIARLPEVSGPGDKMSKHLQIIMKEMCKRVKAPWKKIDFKKDHWFMDFNWTKQKEVDFANWLSYYLYSSKEARLELYDSVSTRNKKWCKQAADFFTSNYGWTIKEKEKK